MRFTLLFCLIAQVAWSASVPTATVSTVGELASRTPLDDDESVQVLGYFTRGDWGEAKTFNWTPESGAAPNDVIRMGALPTGRYIHPWDGDIRAFGIVKVGDSTADVENSAAWNRMIDHATANGQSDHQEIVWPSGPMYYVGSLRTWGSQWPNPGGDFYTGRMTIRGQGPESSWAILTGATNNGLEVIQGRVVIRDLCISSTPTRKAATNSLTSLQQGNGIFVRQYNTNTSYPAHCLIENVFVREQPAAGIFHNGATELITHINVVCHDNAGPGVLASGQNDLGPLALAQAWSQMYMSCRALRNGRGGFIFTNAWNTVLFNCQSLNNNAVHGHVVLAVGRNNFIWNLNTENNDKKISAIPPYTATNIGIFFNQFTTPGFNPQAAGVTPGMNMVVSGTVNNDRYQRITAVTSSNITCSSEIGTTPTENPATCTLEFTEADVGIHLNSAEGTKIVGGHFGTLVVGGVLFNSTNTIWEGTHFGNANIVNWTGDSAVMFAGGNASNNIVKVSAAPNPPGGFHRATRDIGFNDNNTVFWGGVPDHMVIGRDGQGTPIPLELNGGGGGGAIMRMKRYGVSAAGFALSSSTISNIAYARLVAGDGSNNASMWSAQASPIQPAFTIGPDALTGFSHTNTLIRAGRAAAFFTNYAGINMTLAPGAGTGLGDPGIVKLAAYQTTGNPTNMQTIFQDRLAVTRSGVLITDGAYIASTNELGLHDFNTNLVLEVKSTTKLANPFPVMSTVQANLIPLGANGWYYNTNLNRLESRIGDVYYSHPRAVKYEQNLDFGSIPASTFAALAIAATAVNTNDCVIVCADLAQDLIVQAGCRTNGAVYIKVFNPTAAPIDPPLTTYEGWIIKR